MLVLMCKEEAHVKRSLLTKQLAALGTQVLEGRTLKDHMPLIIKSTRITSAANPLKAADAVNAHACDLTRMLQSKCKVKCMLFSLHVTLRALSSQMQNSSAAAVYSPQKSC